jgi:hypothetical protein
MINEDHADYITSSEIKKAYKTWLQFGYDRLVIIEMKNSNNIQQQIPPPPILYHSYFNYAFKNFKKQNKHIFANSISQNFHLIDQINCNTIQMIYLIWNSFLLKKLCF